MTAAAAKPFTADTGLYSSSVNTNNVLVNSNLVLGGNNPTAIAPYIVDSALESLGVLRTLTVNGTTNLKASGTTVLSVINGQVVLSSKTLGSINNVDIGQTKPGKVRTSELTLSSLTGPGVLNIPDVDVDATNTRFNGDVTFVNGVTLTEQPSNPSDATRKDYVDALSIAYSVVFGA
jgi:hypothetical protein